MKSRYRLLEVITFAVLSMLATNVYGTASSQSFRYVEQFKTLDEQAVDRRTEGRLRASIAFDHKLARHNLKISVDRAVVTVTGDVPDEALKQRILLRVTELVAPDNIELNVLVIPDPTVNESKNRLSLLFNSVFH